ICPEPEQGGFLQFAIMPAMMINAHDNYRNRTSAGRHRRAAAATARGKNHVAAHISRAAAPQLPTVFLGTIGLAYRHMDATDHDELVRLPNYQLKIFARPCRRDRFCANGLLVHMGWRVG